MNTRASISDYDEFFLPYQQRVIADQSQLILIEKSRQIGFSWTTAFKTVWEKSLEGAKLDAWISSRDEMQARLFKEDCQTFATVVDKASQDLGSVVIDADRKISAHVLALSSGCRIHCLSSNPDAQAGKRGDRILDEFALHPDPKKLYTIALPGVTWGGKLVIISTHRGTTNYFNELVQEVKHKGNPKKLSLHTVTLQMALEEGFLRKLKEKLPADDPRQAMDDAAYFDYVRAGCADEESFQQEYMCQPADDNSAFLSYDLIATCEYGAEDGEVKLLNGEKVNEGGVENQSTNHTVSPSAQLYVGVDVGRDHDLTVIWVVEKIGDVAFTREVIAMKGATFEAQERALYAWLDLPQVRRCCIDQTGIGRQFAERAQQRFGKYRVEAIHFTAAVKEELAYPVRAAFESRRVRIPNDAHIRADLRAIKKETTASSHVRFTADRGRNGHADRFWALALALHAGKQVRWARATLLDDGEDYRY